MLEGQNSFDDFNRLVANATALRIQLEKELQAGRDRLLEYNSCRPSVSGRIVQAMHEMDNAQVLPVFLDRYLDALNVDYSISRDDSWVIHPIDSTEVQDISGLPLDEDGMTLTFDRTQALTREDMAYMTLEHPLMTAVLEYIKSGTFANTSVVLLKSSAMPQGLMLIENHFRVEAIAPKHLNLSAYLSGQIIRVLLAENGNDLTKVATPDKLLPIIDRLDKAKARQVVKARHEVIGNITALAKTKATDELSAISTSAQSQFADHLDKEIGRLQRLQAINPNVRDDEIAQLIEMKEQGLTALANLSLVPDSIRVLICVKPD